MAGERPSTYLNARPDASGYRIGNPMPVANARHMFYHVVVTEEQKAAVEASFRQLGLTFRREQNPVNFDVAKKAIEDLERKRNKDISDHGHTRRLRHMEKETMEGIFDTFMFKMGELEETARREEPQDPDVYLEQHIQYINCLKSTMAAIEGVQEKVRKEHDNYMKNKKWMTVDDQKKELPPKYIVRQPATATATVIVKPKDEGAISALALLGEDDEEAKEEGESDMKDLPLLEGEVAVEQESATTSAQKNFQEALAKSFQTGESDEDQDGSDAPELERFIDDDMKPPKLEAETGLERPPPIRLVTRRHVDGSPIMKRPRILGNNGVTYKVLNRDQPPTVGSMCRLGTRNYPSSRLTIREQGEGRLTVADLQLNKVHSINTVRGLPVNLRPTSSTVLPGDIRDKLIADGLNKHPSTGMRPVPARVDSVIYRKDYKNPPAPLPADDGTHVLCHLCQNRIMCTRLSNLTNHVRRHSAAKQYQCAHCTYQHNEQAKVRLHMANNHNDETSQPQDNLTKDMQKVWEYLMDECFPGYLDQLKRTNPHSAALNWDRSGVAGRVRIENLPTTLDGIHSCLECGEAIPINSQLKNMTATEPLVDHLKTEHSDLCVAHVCSECGYANADNWKVRWHVSHRHKNSSEIEVNQGEEGEHMEIFLYKFFPSIESVVGPREDPDEVELKDAMGGNDADSTLPSSSTRISPDGDDIVLCKEEVISDGEEGLDRSLLKKNYARAPGKVDVSTLREKEVLCELCNKILIWENKNTLCTLLAHAKRHFKIKQFQCQECSYASSESQHVKQHMLQRHNQVGRPKEHNNNYMQSSWLSVMRKCFPLLRERIDSFKFKTAKSAVRQEREERERGKQENKRERTPPSHGYATRRKRSFQP